MNRRNLMAKATKAGIAGGGLVGSVGVGSATSADYAIRAVCPKMSSTTYIEGTTPDAVQSLVDQINQDTSKSATALDRVFYEWVDKDSPCELFDAAVYQLEERGLIEHNDILLVGSRNADFNRTCHTISMIGYDVYGGIHYNEKSYASLTKNVGIQELGHGTPFGVSHGDGNVIRQTSGDQQLYTSVSPMATTYTYDSSGTCDSTACTDAGGILPEACGGDSPPDNFCDYYGSGMSNYAADGFDCDPWDPTISPCYRNLIDNAASDFTTR